MWIDDKEIGAIFHHDPECGGTRFVRCQVISMSGSKYLRPVALVGKWLSFDLPRRELDDSVKYPLYAHMVINQDGICLPEESSIYESDMYLCRGTVTDPRYMPVVEIVVPEVMSAEEKRQVILTNAINTCRVIATPSKMSMEDPLDPEDVLREIIARAEKGLKDACAY